MVFLVHILLAIGVLVAGIVREGESTFGVGWIPLLAVLPYALLGLWRWVAIRRGFRLAWMFSRIASFSGVLAYSIAVGSMGWVDFVRAYTGQALRFDDWPDWGLVVCFLPFVVFQIISIHAEALIDRGRRSPVGHKVRLRVRSLLAAMAPIAIYMLVSIISARSEIWRVNIESVELFGGLYFLGITFVLGALMPTLLSHTWDTVALPQGPARQLFDDVAQQAGFKAHKVLLWNTGNMMANAAIVGMSSRNRIVLLSDSLLSMLGERELACVYGHEIGHAKRHHVPIFLGWTVFFLLGGDLVAWSVFPADSWWGIAAFAVTLVLWYVCFGWLSRRFELEADLFSMKLTGDPEALIQALERVGGGNRDRAGWRHMSTSKRVSFLHRATFDDVFRLRFLRRIRLLGRAGLILGTCVAFMYLGSLVQRFEGDRVRVHLALGNYDSAWELQQEFPGNDTPEWRAILHVAGALADLEGEEVPLDRLRSVLREALQEGQFTRARLLAQLLDLRRVPVARRLVSAMDSQVFPPVEGVSLEDWPEPWREFAEQGMISVGN